MFNGRTVREFDRDDIVTVCDGFQEGVKVGGGVMVTVVVALTSSVREGVIISVTVSTAVAVGNGVGDKVTLSV